MYEPSFLLKPVVSVFELSDPARSIRFCKTRIKEKLKQVHKKVVAIYCQQHTWVHIRMKIISAILSLSS